MAKSYPLPPLHVFERLQISDGLLMNADLWHQAHDYHRQRQNFVYQSLHHPAIIYGLGVVVVDPPDEVQSTYRDRRWIELQPGVAIDPEGNPIVVNQPEPFRIESEPSAGEHLLIYVTVSYVDPADRRATLRDRLTITERFRIVEKMTLGPKDIELCRIVLTGKEVAITPAANVFQPQPNELDFRHRPTIEFRTTGIVHLAQLTQHTSADAITTLNLRYLLTALNQLSSHLAGADTIELIPITPTDNTDHDNIAPLEDRLSSPYSTSSVSVVPESGAISSPSLSPTLLYAPWVYLQKATPDCCDRIAATIQNNGTVLITATFADVGLDHLYQLRQELQTALDNLEEGPDFAAMRQDLDHELQAFDQSIKLQLQSLVQSVKLVTQQMDCPLTGDGDIPPLHPLRTTPFLFAQLPHVEGTPITLLQWEYVLLLIGDLASYWGPDNTLQRPRDAIRTAHELGVNLLTFAWQHQQFAHLQDPSQQKIGRSPMSSPAAIPPVPESLRDRSQAQREG